MNILRKYKIGKLINKPLEGVEKEIIDFMKGITDNLIPFKYDKYPDSIFYMNSEGKWLFEQDNSNDRFYVRYNLVWKILEIDFSMTNEDIKSFIKFMVEESFKFKVSTPSYNGALQLTMVEEAFKSKVSTPIYKGNNFPKGVEQTFKISLPIADDSNTMNKSVEDAYKKII